MIVFIINLDKILKVTKLSRNLLDNIYRLAYHIYADFIQKLQRLQL